MKRILSVVLSLAIIAGVAVFGTACSFFDKTVEQGKIVACGDYLFSYLQRSTNTSVAQLCRTSKTGTDAQVISENLLGYNNLYAYGDKVYYSEKGQIMCYDAKTLQKSVFKKTDSEICGLCEKGVIAYSVSEGIYLYTFDGQSEKIADKNCHIAGVNDKYIFYTQAVSFNDDNNKVSLKLHRYDISSGEKKNTGTFESRSNSYINNITNVYVFSFHAFKDCCVFTCGSLGGSAAIFCGDAFVMNSDGSDIENVVEDSNYSIMVGKDCVYLTSYNDKKFYTVNSKKKVSSKESSVDDVSIIAATADGCSVTSKKVADSSSSYDIYVNDSVSEVTQEKVLDANSLIESSDPRDAYVVTKVEGVSGDKALLQTRVYTYDKAYNPVGWRPAVIRTIYNLADVKTGEKSLIK